METESKAETLRKMTHEEISRRIDELDAEFDGLDTRPVGLIGATPTDGYTAQAIRREQMDLIDELVRRGLF